MAILLKSRKPNPNTINIVPLVTLREGVIFPQTEAVLTFGRPQSISGVTSAVENNSKICFVSQKNSKTKDPDPKKDLYSIGTLCRIIKTLPVNNELHAIVRGISRVKIHNIETQDGKLLGAISEIPDITTPKTEEEKALINHITNGVKEAINLGKQNVEAPLFMRIINSADPIELSHQVSSILNLTNIERQNLLEEARLSKRLKKLGEYLDKEINILHIEQNIATKTQKKFDENMKEAVLRERLKTIQKELGESEEDNEITDLRKKLKLANMPKDAHKKTEKELNRLAGLSIHNPETGYIRTWIETMVELPWKKSSNTKVSLKKAEKVLDHDHFGLEKVKERILEHIAVLKLKSKKKNSKNKLTTPTILCFVGPPGVGKTSVGRSIAKSLGREFSRISLGGVRDEAEIRGHRRTYVGAMPGRIIQAIKDVGTNNPVFMLDEIDKIGADYRGDPSAALLEVLDPEQNSTFHDHYLDIPFDLSKVMFITTANVLDTIPSALRDRLEIIEFTGYTEAEKIGIAKNHLIKKQLESNGLENSDIVIDEPALKEIVQHYTREAGVRDLERQIATIMRKSAKKIASNNKTTLPLSITPTTVKRLLGPERFTHTLAEGKNQVGISTGLAYTQVGGTILFVEVALMPGKGQIILTGQLGNVMKESARAAFSYVRSHSKELGIDGKIAMNSDVHVHVPEGAVPKDGPSAGLAITTALISAFTKKPTRREVAMTGEVTLRGRALGIGGVKEKVIAAHRAGIKEVIMPKDNKKNLIDIPAKVKKDLKFHFVSDMDDVQKVIFASK
jgi:ATP-dependent Lon protease